ncbi:helix-turn-helix domain-containing protein [Paenibacillus sp. LMG 31458]|uniref:Helix-turn-helix domain-containing protein n=1 Tax=Paenibacillus phytorum TaxID=2654977 RepID=A0ABX1Y285_9BACL|nr:cache domain-containing protein [Paenibacillus phytorum]NOU74987.1 helix-turn-helix domain-containing protein [Paenibacillus phytorum]
MRSLKIWGWRKSIVWTWFISYLIILFLPIGVSFIVYQQSSKVLMSEITRANTTMMNQVRDALDNRFENIERLNTVITFNTNVQDLIYSNMIDADQAFKTYQVTRDLQFYTIFYPFVDDYYIYNARTDQILTSSSIRNSRLGYELTLNGGNLSYDKWLSNVTQKGQKVYRPIERVSENGKLTRSLALISSFPAAANEQPVGSVVIMIDEARLQEIVNKVQLFNGGEMFILDKDNQSLLSNSPDQSVNSLIIDSFAGDTGTLFALSKGKESQYFFTKSTISGLKYVLVVPRQLFWGNVEYIRLLTYITLLLVLLGGLLLVLFFIRRNYNPVNKLLQTIQNETRDPKSPEENEFNFIQQALFKTLDEKQSFRLKLNQQNHLLRSNFISRLLKGRLDTQIPLEEALNTFNMTFSTDDFAVILFFMENNDEFISRVEGRDDAEKIKLMYFIITNIVEEIARKRHAGYIAEVDEMLACLTCFREGTHDEQEQDLLNIALEAQAYLRDNFRIHLEFSISAVHATVEGIAEAYKEAMDVMEYRVVTGNLNVISFNETHKHKMDQLHSEYYYPLQVEQQLINYVKIGDVTRAKQTLDDIFDRNINKALVSVQMTKCLMFNMVSTFIKTINEIGNVEETGFMKNQHHLNQLMFCESIGEMKTQLTAMLQEVCDYTFTERKRRQERSRYESLENLVDNVLNYIGSHYQDVNLNISSIAEHFQMKSAYLSQLYKEQRGEGILDDINKFRINRAKEWLKLEQLNVNEVAKRVGFNEVTAFIRVFKKYEGITPGRYKELESEN